MTDISKNEMIRQMGKCIAEDYAIYGMMPGDANKAPPSSVRFPNDMEEAKRFAKDASPRKYRASVTCICCGREWKRTGRFQHCPHCHL